MRFGNSPPVKSIIGSFIFAALFLSASFAPQHANGMEIAVHMDFARLGERILALANFDIPPEYHAYSNAPGDAGKPTRLDLVLENEGAMPVYYPAGTEEPDIYNPAAKVRVYNGHIGILAILPDYSRGKLYTGTLEMLLCSNRRCLPAKTQFTGHVPENIPALGVVPWKRQAEDILERQGDSSSTLSLNGGMVPQPSVRSLKNVEEMAAAEQQVKEEPIENADNFNLNLLPQYADANVEIYSLGNALFMGLLAGLLLNAMPCVLPVLTLKVSGILLMGNLDDKQKLKHFRAHNICFAAGIMTLFTALALLLGLADLMWGQLYQSQAVLLVLLILVFLMGISMLGVFTLPAFNLRLGENTRNPMLQSYLTGLVSTFLATPCSGPLLGGVLAWAFIQPLPVLMAVFWSVGLGMGLPYIAFSICPRLSHILPRPGAWMHVFERVLGFLLLGTALYLLSILPQDKYIQILIVLLAASFGMWLWGTYCGYEAPRWRRHTGNALVALFLAMSIFWVLQPAAAAPRWQAFSPETFARELGRKPMLVEFTADWCPNCKFLEATLLETQKMNAWQRKYGFELIKVDLTNSSPYAEKLLAQLGSKSIPLTALFPNGENAKKPLILRDIYGEKSLLEAMKTAFSDS